MYKSEYSYKTQIASQLGHIDEIKSKKDRTRQKRYAVGWVIRMWLREPTRLNQFVNAIGLDFPFDHFVQHCLGGFHFCIVKVNRP